jgi:hypothetical protein
MAIVYDEAPASTVQYDEAPPPLSPSASVFERGAPPLAGLSGLVAPGVPTPPDKYQQAAIAERDRLLKAGVPLPEGYTRRLMSGPLLGWGDEAAAAMTTPLEMIRQRTFNPAEGYRYAKAREDLAGQAAQEKTGVAGDVTELVGGLATLPGNVFGREAAAALGGAGKGVVPSLARMAGYGAEAGTLGAVQGAGNAPTIEDIPKNALMGGVLSAALGAPFGHFANVTPRSTAAVPTQSELFGLGAGDQKARDAVGLRYDLEHVADRMRDVAEATRLKYGRDTPQTVGTLRNLADEAFSDVARAKALNPNPANPVAVPGQTGAPNPWMAVATPRDIASLRREVYEGGATGSRTDERAGTIASKIIDRILTRPDPASLASGSARDAATVAMLEARRRGNFSAGYRDKAVTEAIDKTVGDAGSTASGLNFENRLRQNLNAARKRDEFGNLVPHENVALEKLITGTAKANKIREISNLLGGGGGLGRAAVMGGGAGGGALGAYLTGNDPIAGAAVGLGLGQVGRVLRGYGNAQARKSAEAFSDLIRQRSPEYASRAAAAPMEIGPGISSPIARGLRTGLTTAGDGGVRDAIANSIIYNTTGNRDALKRVYITKPDEEQR